MSLPQCLHVAAGCSVVLCLVIAALAGLNLLGGGLAPWLALSRGGTLRLGWDLAWLLRPQVLPPRV